MRLCVFLVAAFVLCSSSVCVSADFCNDNIVREGETKIDVLAKCGEPDMKQTSLQEDSERIDFYTKRKITIQVEDWTYNFGPDRFIKIFRFKNGVLTEIQQGGYGYRKQN